MHAKETKQINGNPTKRELDKIKENVFIMLKFTNWYCVSDRVVQNMNEPIICTDAGNYKDTMRIQTGGNQTVFDVSLASSTIVMAILLQWCSLTRTKPINK